MKVSRLIPFMAQCFFIFLHNRERIRLNKKVQKTGDDLYSGIEACLALTKEQTKFLFKTRRITNIFRRLDETSIAFTRLMAEYVDDFRGNPKNRGVDDNRIMGYAVFTMAIWRVFGTPMFARECGLLTTWNWQQKKRIKAIVEKYRDMDELPRILTMAYKPGSLILHRLQSKPPEWREIDIVFDTRMDDLWCIVFDLVRCAQKTHSWKVVCDFACQVRHLGDGSFRKRGPGFQCKELVQDLLDMRFFGGRKAVVDINTWCAVGPGAKRGLNWICQRHPVHFTEDLDQKQALLEMRVLYDHILNNDCYKPYSKKSKSGLAIDPRELELHDIQFGLCEFDKFLRPVNTHPYIPSNLSRGRTSFYKYDYETAMKSWLYDCSEPAKTTTKKTK
eukprot:GEMP01028177.1.p1 GENE.GEMP01028177.1~~GEMP01028177.1.p1  ORF type:complete len:389 (+),score=49.07 GEMP01028177.1:382-1548(+)